MGRDYGYQGVELRVVDGELIEPTIGPGDRERVRRTLKGAGLPVVAIDSSVRLTAEEAAGELSAFLELAHDWEAPVVRVFGGALPQEGENRRRAIGRSARVLERAAARADQLGTSVALETHDYFAASAVVAELLALVPAPAAGAVWDSHHPHRVGETPEEVFANLGPRLKLVQVKDAARDPGDPSGWRLVLLGQGEVPVRRIVHILVAAGYTGWVSVEWEKKWHPEIEEPEVALPQHRQLLAQWLSWSEGLAPGAT
ncbi:MAG TPA: sugar phosphate isomerase/epimerase family protein [Acidimicrobiales bacterium]|nr:sugar phosphate isomerase/epimerase family protein [Acidimicrobiales bacterium]